MADIHENADLKAKLVNIKAKFDSEEFDAYTAAHACISAINQSGDCNTAVLKGEFIDPLLSRKMQQIDTIIASFTV